MKVTYFVILLVFNVLIITIPNVKCAGAIVSLSPQTVDAKVGTSFTLNVNITNSIDLYGFEYKIFYDTTYLECTSQTKGTFFPDSNCITYKNDVDNIAGKAWYSLALVKPELGKNGNGILSVLLFKPKAKALTIINFTSVKLSDSLANSMLYTTENCSINITINSSIDNGTGIGTGDHFSEEYFFDISIVAVHNVYSFKLFFDRTTDIDIELYNNCSLSGDVTINCWIINKEQVYSNSTLTIFIDSYDNKTLKFSFGLSEGNYTAYSSVARLGDIDIESNIAIFYFSVGNMYMDLFVDYHLLIIVLSVISASILILLAMSRKKKKRIHQDTWYNSRGVRLPIINSESNLNAHWDGGTDPRNVQISGAVWLGLTLRQEMLNGVSYHIHFTLAGNYNYETTKSPYGGYGFGMTDSVTDTPYFPYCVYKMLANNLSINDKIVYTNTTNSNIRVIAWDHYGKLNILLIHLSTAPETISFSPTTSFTYQKLDDPTNSNFRNAQIQSGTMNSSSIVMNGYTVMLLQK